MVMAMLLPEPPAFLASFSILLQHSRAPRRTSAAQREEASACPCACLSHSSADCRGAPSLPSLAGPSQPAGRCPRLVLRCDCQPSLEMLSLLLLPLRWSRAAASAQST